MASHSNPIDRQLWPGKSCANGRRRRGSIMIEAVISVALLGTATYALAKLAKSASELGLQSDQRLSATLTAENTVERLSALPASALADQADDVAKQVAEASRCEVLVSTEPFTAGDREGIHVQVKVMPSSNIHVTLHDWRLGGIEKLEE